ncbi:hypothetical protein AOC36_02670 [Erysipelothrix larvae]|uniref:Isochorismatase-like domain-containing protein n=1 Tax=Erysipelothrix larvae TaxID=1514105 RepID=A0A120JTH7_9FIRM|nr:isochorismatase family protein [Erysipelothrix larvae]AMC92926.1 hypothetical protein AOC36_02670 [Erysipelothrix larvae]
MELNDSLLLVVDYQERLMPVIHDHAQVLNRAIRMVDAFNIFEAPVLVTEQYPKGLGSTVQELSDHFTKDTKIIEKTRFSALCDELMVDDAFLSRNHVVLIGVETHVCVYQTVQDLIKEGYQVSVVYDAVSSRFEMDRACGFEAIKALGARVVTSEMIIYELMGDATHPKFKDILKIVK